MTPRAASSRPPSASAGTCGCAGPTPGWQHGLQGSNTRRNTTVSQCRRYHGGVGRCGSWLRRSHTWATTRVGREQRNGIAHLGPVPAFDGKCRIELYVDGPDLELTQCPNAGCAPARARTRQDLSYRPLGRRTGPAVPWPCRTLMTLSTDSVNTWLRRSSSAMEVTLAVWPDRSPICKERHWCQLRNSYAVHGCESVHTGITSTET